MFVLFKYQPSEEILYSDIVEVVDDATIEDIDVIYWNWILDKIGDRGSWEIMINPC